MVDPFDPSRFVKNNTCLPCCAAPVATCACALLIPPFSAPYADYATAQTAIADQVADCYGYSVVAFDAFTVDVTTANEVSIHTDLVDAGAFTENCVSITKDSSDLTVDWTDSYTYAPGAVPDPEFNCWVYDCNGNEVATDASGDLTGTFTFIGLPAGTYYIKMNADDANGDQDSVVSDVTISATALVPNPVIALWDDSGTTRQLEACPKMLLPIGTEGTGTWFASCADADTDITDNTDSCYGYFAPDPDATSSTKSATGGSSLSLDYSISGPSGDITSAQCAGSFSAPSTSPISISYSFSTDDSLGAPFELSIVDTQGGGGGATHTNSRATPGTTSSSYSFTPLYPGRYEIFITCLSRSDASTLGCSCSVPVTASPIQALWDSGLDCPSRLNCGDACP